jgi:hypothetical protein
MINATLEQERMSLHSDTTISLVIPSAVEGSAFGVSSVVFAIHD